MLEATMLFVLELFTIYTLEMAPFISSPNTTS